MEYEKVDENAKYLKACENVKKIVNAIKLIKIKYYPNFSKISEKDKEVYEQLEDNLEKISGKNNLNKLKIALMEEVSAKYDKKEINSEKNGNQFSNDELLLACYGAIDAQKEALSFGKIKQAQKCQSILKQYMKQIDSMSFRELVINYKREKFGELIKNRDMVQKRNETVMNYMKDCYEKSQVIERQYANRKIEEAKHNSSMMFNGIRKNKNETDINTEGLLLG